MSVIEVSNLTKYYGKSRGIVDVRQQRVDAASDDFSQRQLCSRQVVGRPCGHGNVAEPDDRQIFRDSQLHVVPGRIDRAQRHRIGHAEQRIGW